MHTSLAKSEHNNGCYTQKNEIKLVCGKHNNHDDSCQRASG